MAIVGNRRRLKVKPVWLEEKEEEDKVSRSFVARLEEGTEVVEA